MKAMQTLSTATLVGVSIALFASQADAQSARRQAAIERCIAQAQAQFPFTGDQSYGRNRTAAYKACMRAAGQRP